MRESGLHRCERLSHVISLVYGLAREKGCCHATWHVEEGTYDSDFPLQLVAYGPPGSTGETNVSVIVSPLAEGFDLDGFGTPQQMGQSLLDLVIAPPENPQGKVAKLIDAAVREVNYSIQLIRRQGSE